MDEGPPAPQTHAFALHGALHVETECTGCVLDVFLERLPRGIGREAAELLPAVHRDVSEGQSVRGLADHAHWVPSELERGHVQALRWIVFAADSAGRVHEQQLRAFVRIRPNGDVEDATWADFVCEEGILGCHTLNGQREIVLSGVRP